MANIRKYLIKPDHDNYQQLLKTYQAVDCSWHLPSTEGDGYSDFEKCRLPNALFFDIDAASAPNAPYPHTLPTADHFINYCHSVGIDKHSQILLYDYQGVICAFRVWYMMREFGFENVYILDGGLSYWSSQGLPLASQSEASKGTSKNHKSEPQTDHDGVGYFCQTEALLGETDLQIIDARAQARFWGEVAEPRPGVRSGHMPGAVNIPYTELFDENGLFKTDDALKELFRDAGVKLEQKITTSCGSGVTASVVAFALHCVGATDVRIYDGSWAEWGSRHELPIIGPASA